MNRSRPSPNIRSPERQGNYQTASQSGRYRYQQLIRTNGHQPLQIQLIVTTTQIKVSINIDIACCPDQDNVIPSKDSKPPIHNIISTVRNC